MNRMISLSIEDIYIKYAGEAFGATGSHNALTLRMAFGSAWDGTAKTAYFTDALGSASVSIVLGLDKLVDGAYEVDVPSEALKYAGEATVTVKGVLTSGDITTRAITTAAGHFRVLDSELPESAGNAGAISASDKEQLQAEIAALEPMFTAYKQAAETAAANAKASEEAAAGSAENAAASASTAQEGASTASSQAAAAGSFASSASASEAAAAGSAASASNASMSAQSWAVGGTGTRDGEDTNNAKYWSEQAKSAAGGDFATKAEAQGYVNTHNQSAEAHSDIRAALATHAAQHASGGSDPITPESIGAVPYLGMKSCASDSEVEAAIDTFYGAMSNISAAYASINMTAGSELFSGGVHTLFLSKTTQDAGYVQRAMYDTSSKGTAAARKVKYAGAWQPWEFSDPPLTPGVEYRTTERLNGKPVYKKLDTDGVVKWRIDGETEWKPEVRYTGAAAVLATTTPSRTVTVAASELAAYVAALPRLLTEDITINVGAGTCSDTLKISGFYGCGSITILGASDYGSVFSGGITIQHCPIHVDIRGVSVSTNSGTVVSVATAAYVYLESCKIDGSSATYCVSAYEGARLSMARCSLVNCSAGSAVLCGHTAVIAVSECSASQNQTGAYVYRGGIVLLAGSTPDTLGGSANKKGGGLIVKANGTLL